MSTDKTSNIAAYTHNNTGAQATVTLTLDRIDTIDDYQMIIDYRYRMTLKLNNVLGWVEDYASFDAATKAYKAELIHRLRLL